VNIKGNVYTESIVSRFVWNCKLNQGDRYFPRLIIDEKPIAHKYCEGKVKRPLKRA